jgi:hypothetical protein
MKRAVNVFLIVSFIALVGLAVIAWAIWKPFSHHPENAIVDGLFGGIIGALFTLLLAWLAWMQLSSILETTSADFITRLKNDFFQEQTRTLITLVANEWIEFIEDYDCGKKAEIPFFQVCGVRSTHLPNEIKDRLAKQTAYTAFEMDDLLLGPLEDVATLWERRIIDIGLVDTMFGWYVAVIWENCEVQKYIRNQRRDEAADLYSGLEDLYAELKRRWRKA